MSTEGITDCFAHGKPDSITTVLSPLSRFVEWREDCLQLLVSHSDSLVSYADHDLLHIRLLTVGADSHAYLHLDLTFVLKLGCIG